MRHDVNFVPRVGRRMTWAIGQHGTAARINVEIRLPDAGDP